MSSSLTQSAAPVDLRAEHDEELSAWTRYYLLKDVNSSIEYAQHELERIDFLWGRIRSDRGASSPAIKADIRVEQYCVLNQILEFHGIAQSQVGRLAALKEFMLIQRHDLMNDEPSNDDVDVYVGIVQRTFQSLGRICQELRNAANVLRLPSRRRFPVFRGQKVEIVEYSRVSVPIPQLEEMLCHLDEQIAWLVHVRDNVKALLDCQDLYGDYYD
ncbi:hypothetical protein BBJ28_00017653 [Nothophytophthora sp. Chile5]|nr:hypothetical protein BBJ28_00017653 [Nothophytophthora sp. Chile5]